MNQSTHSGHDGVWAPCGTCWGQRRIFRQSAGGGGLVPHACDSCLGLGERLSGGDRVPAPLSRDR